MLDPLNVRATLLGTGTSTGVPIPGCTCVVCTSKDPKDTRLRCSCLIEVNGLSILIDTGPDFRTQCLERQIREVDAVLYTHEHFDHVAGLDDLRPFLIWNKTLLPCFAASRTAAQLRARHDYIFVDGSYPGVPKLTLNEIEGPFEVVSRYDKHATVQIHPIAAHHGELPILGFRIGGFAYMTDVSGLPAESYDALAGVETLVLSALRPAPHPTHFSIDEAIEASRQIGAQKTYFIHMTHNILHSRDNEQLPDGIQFAFDGMVLEVGG